MQRVLTYNWLRFVFGELSAAWCAVFCVLVLHKLCFSTSKVMVMVKNRAIVPRSQSNLSINNHELKIQCVLMLAHESGQLRYWHLRYTFL